MSDFIKSLSPGLFWDVDVESIDDSAHRRFVIERVLERGELSDLRAMKAHYTMQVIINEAQQMRSLDPVTLAFAACLGNVKEETFRCYTSKQYVDCVTYSEFPWLDAPVIENGIRLASIRDIAAMKVNAITNRGTRKDFVDLAFLLNGNNMADIFQWYSMKYRDANPALALRSLSYFVDAEMQPMPRMLKPFDWEAAKIRIQAAVREFL